MLPSWTSCPIGELTHIPSGTSCALKSSVPTAVEDAELWNHLRSVSWDVCDHHRVFCKYFWPKTLGTSIRKASTLANVLKPYFLETKMTSREEWAAWQQRDHRGFLEQKGRHWMLQGVREEGRENLRPPSQRRCWLMSGGSCRSKQMFVVFFLVSREKNV